MKNIIFYVRHFTERGTEIAVYDYAKYNEEILGNKSFIVHMSLKMGDMEDVYNKFKARFTVLEIDDMRDITRVIRLYNIDFFYTLTHGDRDIYEFDNKRIWLNCKTIKHCVFTTTCKEGDYYFSISNYLNYKNGTVIPVIPHIVEQPIDTKSTLREQLGLPTNAIVIGRYGGFNEFNIKETHDAIYEYLTSPTVDPNVYFLFMNTRQFAHHNRIIYLNKNIDFDYKERFVNTCDAMIHARIEGETFGLSIAEFSIRNKPVITCPTGDMEHTNILGDKAIIYTTKDNLITIFNNIWYVIRSRTDWNAYSYYSPTNIMEMFDAYIFAH
jgi:hypothetical protein